MAFCKLSAIEEYEGSVVGGIGKSFKKEDHLNSVSENELVVSQVEMGGG